MHRGAWGLSYHALAEVADCDHLYCMLLGLWYGLHLPTSPTAATHIPHLNITVMLARCCTCWVSIPPNLKFSPKSHILRLSAWVLRNCHFGSPNEQQKRPPSPTRCLDFPSGLCLELRNPLALLQRATKCDFIFWVQVDAFWEASVTHQALEMSLSSFYTFHYPGCSGMQLLRRCSLPSRQGA